MISQLSLLELLIRKCLGCPTTTCLPHMTTGLYKNHNIAINHNHCECHQIIVSITTISEILWHQFQHCRGNHDEWLSANWASQPPFGHAMWTIKRFQNYKNSPNNILIGLQFTFFFDSWNSLRLLMLISQGWTRLSPDRKEELPGRKNLLSTRSPSLDFQLLALWAPWLHPLCPWHSGCVTPPIWQASWQDH